MRPIAADCKRTIPACAGEPERMNGRMTAFADYPRVCGGTPNGIVRQFADLGLSPRVRGNRVLQIAWLSIRRTIPACAGEPSPR